MGGGPHQRSPSFLLPPLVKKVALFIFVGVFSTLMVFFIYLEDYLCFINKSSEFVLFRFLGWAGRLCHQLRGGCSRVLGKGLGQTCWGEGG